MKDKTIIDGFNYHFINNIDPDILNSFSSKQLTALENAVKETQAQNIHPIDFSGTINLFCAKYYFLFLMGRDRRTSTQETELGRREDIALLGNLSFLIFALSPFVLLMFFLLYILKIGFGIDLYPGRHIGGLLGF